MIILDHDSRIPIEWSFSERKEWFTLSKAFEKSVYIITSIWHPAVTITLRINVWKTNKFVVFDFPFLNPC